MNSFYKNLLVRLLTRDLKSQKKWSAFGSHGTEPILSGLCLKSKSHTHSAKLSQVAPEFAISNFSKRLQRIRICRSDWVTQHF